MLLDDANFIRDLYMILRHDVLFYVITMNSFLLCFQSRTR
jgi:hypothetical protein